MCKLGQKKASERERERTVNRNGKMQKRNRERASERTEEKLRNVEREKESVQRKSTCRLKGSCMQHRTRRTHQRRRTWLAREKNSIICERKTVIKSMGFSHRAREQRVPTQCQLQGKCAAEKQSAKKKKWERTLQQNHVKQTNTATRRADCRGKDSRSRARRGAGPGLGRTGQGRVGAGLGLEPGQQQGQWQSCRRSWRCGDAGGA